MKELSIQEQMSVTGGMIWEIAALVLGLVGASSGGSILNSVYEAQPMRV